MDRPTRRELLGRSAAAVVGGFLGAGTGPVAFAAARCREKLPVAAIVTVYNRSSHADVIVGKILEGYRQDGGVGPDLRLLSLYTDQVSEHDISRALAEKHGFPIVRSIDEALTLGTDQIQVAGVLSIGEHGDYPLTPDTKQRMYPRRRFFDEIVATFRRCGKSVPVFNDKHLSWRWDDARFMVDTARSMNFPLLAGSSLPVAWRFPALELPRDCEIDAALSVGYGGLEDYGYHAIEAHQSLIERRRGGESGIVSVQAVQGEEIRRAESEGRWSSELFAAALRQLPGAPQDTGDWTSNSSAAVYLLKHRDGLQSAVVMANGLAGQFAGAVRLKGQSEPRANWFRLQEGAPFGHFAYLVKAIEHTVHTGVAAYPAERTLLTTGITARIMQSLAQNGALLETPELEVSWTATDWPFANHPASQLEVPFE